ncbi:ABC transporter substrate-binding protein [Desulfomonile tiedjei]|uniref:ABC-type branched-chain amino acid transport system, periplasmic component n=1 Tax=Desulfomonile tiedjei (strain ATCC 49306 / DSM 6799 / DCB-1) TaxID=706587 RepID=I4C1E7_DESTA|nr:ABC transporter substrate-binding protein [Desulfomonile tiedjei]AFM23388.1 ABC-type branched-chain amino acid transport system, periplasmic component [Desulfomonile tiedjei DSM 6799]
MRRLVLLTMILLLCGSSPALPGNTAKAVKIVFLSAFTAEDSVTAGLPRQGAETALKDINPPNGTGISGRIIQGIFVHLDTAQEIPTPTFEALASGKDVDLIVAFLSEDFATEVSGLAKRLGVPLIITNCLSRELALGKSNRYTFNIGWNSCQIAKSAAITAANTGKKKWTSVTPYKGTGREVWDLFKEFIKRISPTTEVANDDEVAFIERGATDWSGAISHVAKSGAEGILVTLRGSDLTSFLSRATDIGLFGERREIVIPFGGSIAVLASARARMPVGARIGAPYWYEAKPTSINQQFVETYIQEFGFPPSYEAERAYAAVRLYQMAVTKVGGTDKEGIVNALKTISTEDDSLPAGAFSMRPEDHQGIFNIVWGRMSRHMRAIGPRNRHVMRSLEDIRVLSPSDLALPTGDCRGK